MINSRNIMLVILLTGLLGQHFVSAEIKVYLSPQTVRKGENFHIMIEMRGEQVGEPELPKIEGIIINTAPNISEDRWTLGPMSREHIKVRGYQAVAQKSGKFTFPPVKVTIDGQTEQSNNFQFEVMEVDGTADSKPDSENSKSDTVLSRRDSDLKLEDLLLLETQISKSTAYLQEPLLLRVKRYELNHPRIYVKTMQESEPQAQGFYIIPANPNTIPFYTPNVRIGRYEYRVTERLFFLFPTQTGKLTIEPFEATAVARVRDGLWFVDHELNPKSNTIVIEVKPLPPAPESFTGAVGEFDLLANLETEKTIQGVPITLNVRISGKGNPNAIGAPVLPKVDNLIILLTDSQTGTVGNSETPLFEKIFQFKLTPIQPGKISIPQFSFSYFDPSEEKYVTKPLGPFLIQVEPTSESQKQFADFSKEKNISSDSTTNLSEDIEPIITEVTDLYGSFPTKVSFVLVTITPVILYIAAAIHVQKKKKIQENPSYLRSKYAYKRAIKRLKQVEKTPDPIEEIYKTIVDFVADKWDIPANSLTSAEVTNLLKERNVTDNIVENASKILKKCERARYASHTVTPAEINALIEGSNELLKQLESTI